MAVLYSSPIVPGTGDAADKEIAPGSESVRCDAALALPPACGALIGVSPKKFPSAVDHGCRSNVDADKSHLPVEISIGNQYARPLWSVTISSLKTSRD